MVGARFSMRIPPDHQDSCISKGMIKSPTFFDSGLLSLITVQYGVPGVVVLSDLSLDTMGLGRARRDHQRTDNSIHFNSEAPLLNYVRYNSQTVFDVPPGNCDTCDICKPLVVINSILLRETNIASLCVHCRCNSE